MSLNDTPRANRLHISIFGKRNSGKSSLINALTGQDIALVSDHPGTTTDPVLKSMELHPIGPVVFIDTAGFDDVGDLGKMRIEKTREVVQKTDIALVIFSGTDFEKESQWTKELGDANIPIVAIINKADLLSDTLQACRKVKEVSQLDPILVSALKGQGMDRVRKAIEEAIPEDVQRERILSGMIQPKDLVLLVMPQDIQAPKGRLILPQVQTIRELLDSQCTTVCTTADQFTTSLNALARPPKLIITDSQCFKMVYEKKPEESSLTSFSVLFAAYKGDIHTFTAGAEAVDGLTNQSRVLIAEACTHAPLEEDIGRVKIPAMLRKQFGEALKIDIVAGGDFPADLSGYDLIVHCGACMFNRKHVLSRIAAAKSAGVPITNYGVMIAKLTGILSKINLPQ